MRLQRNPKLRLLRGIPLFAQCSKKDLQTISCLAEEISLPAGALLMREGESGHELFVVVAGSLEVMRGAKGRVAEVGPGEFVGETSLLSSKQRSATVWTATPAHLLWISETSFLRLLDEVPHLGLGIASALAERVPDDPDFSDPIEVVVRD